MNNTNIKPEGTPLNISNQSNNRANLIVNYLPQSLKEHDFNQLFSKIGPLKACKLMFDRQTGKILFLYFNLCGLSQHFINQQFCL
jgi:hypothetical protein